VFHIVIVIVLFILYQSRQDFELLPILYFV